jgi:hypothetical protein
MTTKSKERTKASGEVFTPRSLIREMRDRLPNAVWFDPTKTWRVPAAGDGNFLVEIKARLLQAGHDEFHILETMLFSIELIDDNHWALQHRLGYLVAEHPNPALDPKNFVISKISKLTQDLNDANPYEGLIHKGHRLARDEVLHHRNHVCASGLEYDMSFGRTDDEFIPVLYVLDERDLGAWPETDTPDVGERYVVERMLGKQPQLQHEPAPAKPRKDTKPMRTIETQKTEFFDMVDQNHNELITKHLRILWGSGKKSVTPKALLPQMIQSRISREQPGNFKTLTPELKAEILGLIAVHELQLST